MTSIVERYDRDAADYERYWAPVLDASARRLLDRVAPFVATLPREAPRVADIGTGSGVLALETLDRWPNARVTGFDPSIGMLAMARRRSMTAGRAVDDPQLTLVQATADDLPVTDASMDLAISSFVYQLVPHRAAALREAHRIIRPGGRFAVVTWLDRGDDYPPAVEFDEAVYDLGIEEPEVEDDEDRCSGDFRSARSAAQEIRRAGFARVSAREETLVFDWTPESYLDFKRNYDETSLFGLLDSRNARRLIDRARERFASLPTEAFQWRTPVVSVLAERPA